MARKTLTRTIAITHVKIAEIKMVDGEAVAEELPMETFIGKISSKKAEKMVKVKYPRATVLEVEVEENKYSIDLLDFIEYAEKMEEKNNG